METDYQKMYNNLTVLLQDICQFLNSDRLGALSHRDKKIAESLITRSKVQLQEISKIERNLTCEEYVDMDAKKVLVSEEDQEKLDIYSSADDNNANIANVEITIVDDPSQCPYIDLPAREASQVVKYGFMYMKRKFLLGFEKMKRVYGSIHNKWLLIYHTEKDMKPICTFNLKNYEARNSSATKTTNFELVCTTDRKVYYFMALTLKDMLQWVVNINRCHDNVVLQSKEQDLEHDDISLEEDIGEHYDIVVPTSNGNQNEEHEDEEDDIYFELDDVRKPQNNNRRSRNSKDYDSNIGPPLPTRPQKDLTTVSPPLIQPSTSSHGSEESLASYDDIKELPKPPEKNSDDEDATYEAFVHVKNKITKMSRPLAPQTKTNETIEQCEITESVLIKHEVVEREANVVNMKQKTEKFQVSLSKNDVTDDSENKPKLCNKNVNLFLHGNIKKLNTLSSTSPDVESKNDVNRTYIKSTENVIDLKIKGAMGLSPPIIKKVPVVPVKPKVKDKPSIGKRPPFSSFKQITGER